LFVNEKIILKVPKIMNFSILAKEKIEKNGLFNYKIGKIRNKPKDHFVFF
jgi:hypothetical protein